MSDSDDGILFKLQLPSGSHFKDVLEAISDLSSEAYFDFSHTGLDVQAIDAGEIAFAEVLLPREFFKKYRCTYSLSVGLNHTDMAKAFRWAKENDIITIKSEADLSAVVRCNFMSPDDGEISSFDFGFQPNSSLPIKHPDSFEYKARICMPSAKFVGICNKLGSFTDSEDTNSVVVITVDKVGVMFFASGQTGSSSFIVHRQTQSDKSKIFIELKEPVTLSLELRRMNSFSKASALSDQMIITLLNDIVVFEYKIGNKGYIRYYLPPRGVVGDEMQNEGDDTAKEDKMQNVGEEM